MEQKREVFNYMVEEMSKCCDRTHSFRNSFQRWHKDGCNFQGLRKDGQGRNSCLRSKKGKIVKEQFFC